MYNMYTEAESVHALQYPCLHTSLCVCGVQLLNGSCAVEEMQYTCWLFHDVVNWRSLRPSSKGKKRVTLKN